VIRTVGHRDLISLEAVTTMGLSIYTNGVVHAGGADWRGTGRVPGEHGYYDWAFVGGRRGRTTFSIGADGSLLGKVREADGGGIHWDFVGERAKGAARCR